MSTAIFGSEPFYGGKKEERGKDLDQQEEYEELLSCYPESQLPEHVAGNLGNRGGELLNLLQGLHVATKNSKKFIIIAKMKKRSKTTRATKSEAAFLRALDAQGFFEDYYYTINSLRLRKAQDPAPNTENPGPQDDAQELGGDVAPSAKSSQVQLLSSFEGKSEGNASVFPTLEQLNKFFEKPRLIQNPSHTFRTMAMTLFRVQKQKKIYPFLFEFNVAFSETLVTLHISLQSKKKNFKIRAMPIQYMVLLRLQSGHRVYHSGQGYQCSSEIEGVHTFPVGSYSMLVEVETPLDNAVGEDFNLKISMQSSNIYFMLREMANSFGCSTKYLGLEDQVVQDFYKDALSSIAKDSEEQVFFDQNGEKKPQYYLSPEQLA